MLRRRRSTQSIVLAVESLESRRLLSTSIWTGAGGNHLYSNGANWQSGVAPVSGDDIEFNDLGSAQTVDVDSVQTVGNVFISGNYTITNHTLTLLGNIEANPAATAVFSDSIVPAANNHFTSDAGATLTIGTLSDSSSDTLDKYGDGTLVITGNSNASWQLLMGTMTVNSGTSINLAQYGGTLNSTSGSNSGAVQTLSESGGTVSVDVGDRLTAANTAYFDGGTFATHLNSAVSYAQLVAHSQNSSTGSAITLVNNPTLQVNVPGNFSVNPGSTFVIMDGSGGSGPVNGTFANLPEGATFNAGSEEFSISYLNSDVTLTAVHAVPTVALSASTTTPVAGNAVTLTATLTGNGGTPTGTVTFTDNGTSLGTATVTNGVATLTVPTFPAGSHPVVATYGGNTTYTTAASGTLTITSSSATANGLHFTTPATAAVSTAKAATLTAAASDSTTTLTNGLTYTWSIVRSPSGAKRRFTRSTVRTPRPPRRQVFPKTGRTTSVSRFATPTGR